MRRLAVDLSIVGASAVLFVALFFKLPSHQPYFYDEADYVSAASQGYEANILERPSMSIVDFLRIGLNRNLQTNRASLSDIVRGSRDITFYRHYHGPVYFYWLAAVGPLVHFDEYAMRVSGLCWHIATFAAIYFGVLSLRSDRIAALIASSLFLFGQSNIDTDTQITPHISYVFFTVLTLICFARYLQTGSAKTWYATVATFAAAFCSVEYAILLPVALAATLLVLPDRRPSARLLFRSAILCLCCILILWPFGVLKLSAVKGYFSISYLAVQRTGVYGDGSPLSVWLRRVSDSPAEYSAICAGGALSLFSLARRQAPSVLLPFAAYASLMLLTTLKNRSLNSTYISSILPPLFVISGIAIGMAMRVWKPALRFSIAAAVLLTIGASGYLGLVPRRLNDPMYRPEQGLIAALRAERQDTGSVLVPSGFLPAISYYLPKMKVHGYLKADSPETLLEKVRSYDANLVISEENGHIEKPVIGGIRMELVPVPGSPGYGIVHLDGSR